VLKVFGLPTGPALSTWNVLVERFQLAIHRSRGGHSASFLPTFDESVALKPDDSENFGRWAMSYELTDTDVESPEPPIFQSTDSQPPLDKLFIRPLSLRLILLQSPAAILPGVLNQIKNVDNLSLETLKFKTTPISENEFDEQLEDDDKKGILITTTATVNVEPESAMRPRVRMGSLDLDFTKPSQQATPGTGNFLRLRPIDEVIDVRTFYHIAISDVLPGGQDYAVSEEFDDSGQEDPLRICVRPKPPIVIRHDVQPPNVNAKLLLVVQEKLTDHHRIILEIISQTPGNARDPKLDVCKAADRAVIVLDRNPFLVAEVKYLSFDRVTAFGTTTVATWDSEDGIAGAWQLQLEERPFCLVLPPQAVGEEMIKDQKIDPIKALPFNFSPPTTMELNARRVRSDLASSLSQ
jgi:hypothetical protein